MSEVREAVIEDNPLSRVSLRPMDLEKDESFIISSWHNSYRDTARTHGIESQIYEIEQRNLIQRLLTDERMVCVVACLDETPDQILGWAVGSMLKDIKIVHYVYVKSTFRKLGIGKLVFSVVGGVNCFTTHSTKQFKKISKDFETFYNPYLLGAK